MTPFSQSREDAQEQNKPLVTPRTQIRIGNWNVRTMYIAGNNMEKDGGERNGKSGMEELE